MSASVALHVCFNISNPFWYSFFASLYCCAISNVDPKSAWTRDIDDANASNVPSPRWEAGHGTVPHPPVDMRSIMSLRCANSSSPARNALEYDSTASERRLELKWRRPSRWYFVSSSEMYPSISADADVGEFGWRISDLDRRLTPLLVGDACGERYSLLLFTIPPPPMRLRPRERFEFDGLLWPLISSSSCRWMLTAIDVG